MPGFHIAEHKYKQKQLFRTNYCMQMISVRLCHCLKSEIFRNTDQGNHHTLASTVKMDMEILPFDMTTAGIPVAAMAEQIAYLF